MKKIFTIGFIFINMIVCADNWTQKADFGGMAMQAGYGFSINGKGYIGDNQFMWEYDPSTNAWTQKATHYSFYYPYYFVIGNEGYVGSFNNGFSQYDPVSNIWTNKTAFGGGARMAAVSFSIGSKGYVGLGDATGNIFGNGPFPVSLVDFWEYNPALNLWTQKGNFPGPARLWSVGFSINSKGYVGTGYVGTTSLNDFWEYEPVTDSWLQKANYGGAPVNAASGFSIGNKGYIGLGWIPMIGYMPNFWEYDQITNGWTQKLNFGGGARNYASSFSINGKGYIGVGANNLNGPVYKDFWEYTPDSTTGIINSNTSSEIKIFPTITSGDLYFQIPQNNQDEILEIYNMNGKLLKSIPFRNTVNISDLDNGLYIIRLIKNNYSKKITLLK